MVIHGIDHKCFEEVYQIRRGFSSFDWSRMEIFNPIVFGYSGVINWDKY